MDQLNEISQKILQLTNTWQNKLENLDKTTITINKNNQNRNIKQIIGHLIDSASNNTHRIIHLQYQKTPLIFPDYANLGVNDKWISIQNYKNQDWNDLILMLKYSNIHIAHVIKNINKDKLQNTWISALNQEFTLEEMIIDYPLHFELHLNQIQELINQ